MKYYHKQSIIERIATPFLCVSALFFIVVFGSISLTTFFHKPIPMQISENTVDYIEQELTRRAADDCILTPTSYGWRCEEIGTGKIFKVVAK